MVHLTLMKYADDLKKRAREIYTRLGRAYPEAHCPLQHKSAFQLLVATMLSAQCTDERVNQTTPALFQKYPDAKAIAGAEREELIQTIFSVSFPAVKATNLIAAAKMLLAEYGGVVPGTQEELVKLPGVGRKTANVVLGNWFKVPALTPDTHFQRVTRRLGMTHESDPDKIERDVMELVPRKLWTDFSHWVIWHGRRICQARKPLCSECVVREYCEYYETAADTGQAKGPKRKKGKAT